MFQDFKAALEAKTWRSVGVKFLSDPLKAPKGVLLAPTTKIPLFTALPLVIIKGFYLLCCAVGSKNLSSSLIGQPVT